MGALAGVGLAIAAIVGKIVAAVAVVATAIAAAAAYVISALVTGAEFLVTTAVPYIISAAKEIAAKSLVKLISTVSAIGQATVKTTQLIVNWSKDINAAIQEFLKTIHFSTIIGIHQIAVLVSDDYRDIMRKVWGEVSKVSKAMFGTAEFMHTILLNTRAIVLDVATSTGQTYDLAEITWIEQEVDILKKIQYRTQKYSEHPEKLLEDINSDILKPFLDFKGQVVQTILSSVDGLGQSVAAISETIDSFPASIQAIKDTIPDSIKKIAEPYVSKVETAFADWKKDEFLPVFNPVKQQAQDTAVALGFTKQDVETLENRLLTPGTFLREIANLPQDERAREEKLISDLALKEIRTSAENTISDYETNKPDIIGQLPDLIPPLEIPVWDLPNTDFTTQFENVPMEQRPDWVIKDV